MVKPQMVIRSCLVSYVPNLSQWKLTVPSAAIVKSSKTIKLASIEDKVTMLIHKELLCFFSPYYTAALNGSYSEARKGLFKVDLSGEQLESFVTWIYTGKLTEDTLTCGVRLYIFADQVDIMALRRDIIVDLADQVLLDYDMVKLIQTNLTHNSPLRRFVLESYITHWKPECDDDDPCVLDSDADPDNLLANFMYKVMRGLADRKEVDPEICSCCSNICQYHEHESKEEWKASMLTQTVWLQLLTNDRSACGQDEDMQMPASLNSPK
jgi:hypothetical protein